MATREKQAAKKSTLADPMKGFPSTASHSNENSSLESSGTGHQPQGHRSDDVRSKPQARSKTPPMVVQENSPLESSAVFPISPTSSYMGVKVVSPLETIPPSKSLPNILPRNDAEVPESPSVKRSSSPTLSSPQEATSEEDQFLLSQEVSPQEVSPSPLVLPSSVEVQPPPRVRPPLEVPPSPDEVPAPPDEVPTPLPEENQEAAVLPQDDPTHTSRVLIRKMKKRKLLNNVTRSQSRLGKIIFIKVNGRRGVKLHFFLHPSVSIANGKLVTRLMVTAEVNRSVITQLLDHNNQCWIAVEAKVIDRETGNPAIDAEYAIEFPRHEITSQEGKITFEQDLATCAAITRCSGTKVSVEIVAKFITRHRQLQYRTTSHTSQVQDTTQAVRPVEFTMVHIPENNQ